MATRASGGTWAASAQQRRENEVDSTVPSDFAGNNPSRPQHFVGPTSRTHLVSETGTPVSLRPNVNVDNNGRFVKNEE